jgi:hypothetical protein
MQTEPPKADPPKRRRRWFQFGESWGLLANGNPRATGWSVLWHSAAGAVVVPAVLGAISYLRRGPTEDLPVWLAVFSILGAFVAGVMEWQIDRSVDK